MYVFVPVCVCSRTGKANLRAENNQKGACRDGGERVHEKGNVGTFWGDDNVVYLDGGSDYTDVCMH